MEFNANLESLRELSVNQLEALLQYDSPPETPLPPRELNISQINEPKSFSNYIHYDREQFGPEIDSQIDFSIFNLNSTNADTDFAPLSSQRKKNDHPIILGSRIDAIEIPDKSMQEKEKSFLDDITISNSWATNRIFSGRQEGADNAVEAPYYQGKYPHLLQIVDTSKQIDYNNKSQVSQIIRSHSVDRKVFQCQTQLECKSHFKDIHVQISSSCPPNAANHCLLRSNYKHSKTLNEYNPAKHSELSKLSDVSRREENNLFEKTAIMNSFYKETFAIDDMLDKSQYDYIFGSSNSIKKQSQAPVEEKSQCLFDEDLVKNNNNFTNMNMFVDESSIPHSVSRLYSIVKSNYSDFAFVYALSCQICQERVPMECFVTLKIALLLSLVSIGNNEHRPPIPIVAFANDAYMTDYLMTNVGQMGSRFIGPVDEAKSFSNTNWNAAESILLASGGVYYAGDWTRLKLTRTETILKKIECSSGGVDNSTESFPLETSIWTHWRSFKYGVKDQHTFNKFLKIFGIPIFVSDDSHESLVDYTLEQSSIRFFESTVDHLSINEEDMRNFLVCVSQNQVDLSPEAAQLLKDYFVASRSIRKDCLSKQSYTMLKQFAESFAKISMRKLVLYEDAVAAIVMCEHFIGNIFGSIDNSPPHFGNFDFVGAIDNYFIQFKEWLLSYLKQVQTII